MNSHIVLCEGRRDTHFAKSVIEGCDNKWRVQKVNAEDFDGQEVPYQEQSEILAQAYWDDECYAKSEGSDDSLYQASGMICQYIFDPRPFSVTLVADLDQRPFENLVEDINCEFHANTSGCVEWTDWSHEATADDDELKTWTATVRTDGGKRESFYLATFENDLEDTVGITDNDPKPVWQPKVNEYASRRDVREAFIDLYR